MAGTSELDMRAETTAILAEEDGKPEGSDHYSRSIRKSWAATQADLGSGPDRCPPLSENHNDQKLTVPPEVDVGTRYSTEQSTSDCDDCDNVFSIRPERRAWTHRRATVDKMSDYLIELQLYMREIKRGINRRRDTVS